MRTIALARAEVKSGMMNLVYNMARLGQLLRRDAKAFAPTRVDWAWGRGAPGAACNGQIFQNYRAGP